MQEYRLEISDWHTIADSRSLSEYLNSLNHLNINNYGPGSLSTLSLRGHSTSQTDIALDGFSMTSNMNGVYDISLIPSYFLASAHIRTSAGSSDMNGSIGGLLALKSPEEFPYKNFMAEYGISYGHYQDMGHYLTLGKKWSSEKKQHSFFKAFYRSSENDFPYRNLNQIGTPETRLQNADFSQFGLLQNNIFEFKNDNRIQTNIWYVGNQRNIPPTLTQSSGDSSQEDDLLNVILSWKKNWNRKLNTELSSRFSDEHIYFENPAIQTDSRARKFEFRWKTAYEFNSNHQFHSFVGHEYSMADVDDYEQDRPSLNRTYLQLSYDYNHPSEKFKTGINIKEEIVEQEFSPFLFHAYGRYSILKKNPHLAIGIHISKNHRWPTFNDLFWNISAFSAGNPDLLPEKGWKEELDISFRKNIKRNIYGFDGKLSIFHSLTKDWILWAPDDTGKWTPDNIKSVRSRGFGIDIGNRFKVSKAKIGIQGRYDYTKTTNTAVGQNAENTLGKQLIYVPLHSGSVSIIISYATFRFRYSQIINGKRYTKTDNSNFIDRYAVSNIGLSYLFKKNNWEIEPVLEIRNLLNKEYLIVANRPMPPLHIQGSIYLKFNQ